MSDPSEAMDRPAPQIDAEPGARVFVWGLWAILTAGALVFVWSFGPNVPVLDDFVMVDVVVGARPMTLGWLWSLHNEHRVPLPKLILLVLYRASGNDFRAGMFFNVAALAGLAGAGIMVAGRRAGGAKVFDGLIPLVLLNLSHHVNLLWSWQVQLVLSTVVAGGVVLLIVSRPGWPGVARSAALGVCLTALCLSGANGVALVPALAAWLLLGSVNLLKLGQRKAGLAALAAAAAGLALVVLYFSGYQGPPHHRAATQAAYAASTGMQFVSLMFAGATTDFLHACGPVALGVIGSSALIPAWAIFRGSKEGRPRAIGLLCAFAALGSLVLGLAWGRAGTGVNAGLEPRYTTLVVPLWLLAFFAWDQFSARAVRRVVLTGLFALNLVLLWPETRVALAYGRAKAANAALFEQDVRDGLPLYLLTRLHTPFLHRSQDEVAQVLGMLRKARIGIFGSIAPDPAFHEVAVPVTPTRLRLARWENGTAIVIGYDPELRYVLPKPCLVAGIRLRYSHANRAGEPARFRVRWTPAAGQPLGPERQYSNWLLPTGKDRVTTIWIADLVHEFEIQPDNQRCEFAVHELTLLVP
jgi:hypothetical protein